MDDFSFVHKTICMVRDSLLQDLKKKYIGKICTYKDYGSQIICCEVVDIDYIDGFIELHAAIIGDNYKPTGFNVFLNVLEVEFL